jgi:hypothetical protein
VPEDGAHLLDLVEFLGVGELVYVECLLAILVSVFIIEPETP